VKKALDSLSEHCFGPLVALAMPGVADSPCTPDDLAKLRACTAWMDLLGRSHHVAAAAAAAGIACSWELQVCAAWMDLVGRSYLVAAAAASDLYAMHQACTAWMGLLGYIAAAAAAAAGIACSWELQGCAAWMDQLG
jgi:hypothetical protein